MQTENGSFVSYSSPSHKTFNPKITYHTTFVPAVILGALADVPNATPVSEPLAGWLAAQRSPSWSFNYWAKDAPERTTQPYPDDLDVIACALIGLWRHDPALIDGSALGAVVKLLLSAEEKIGGPYRTWLVPDDSPAVWLDVDPAVNSNIAYLLKLVAQPLPSLTHLIEQTIASGRYVSPYYPSAYPLWYYMARAYNGPHAPQLVHHIMAAQTQAGDWATPLQTILALSALKSLGAPQPATAVRSILAAQQPDGAWPAESFCIDPAQNGRTYYHGAAALTTALAMEMLAQPPTIMKRITRPAPKANTLYTRILATGRQELSQLKGPIKTESLRMLHRIERLKDSQEILTMPQLFLRSLVDPPKRLPSGLLEDLGLANLYGWMAYTVYDDFLDDEGNPKELSAANVAMRYSLNCFARTLPANSAYQRHVHATFDLIDSANAWELAHARFAVSGGRIFAGTLPSYASLNPLAERSLGHTLPPLGVLAAMGIPPTAPQALAIQNALKHYIIARQLSDDIHDWHEDIRAGRITYAVACVLRDMNLQPGGHNLKTLMPRMQRYFWHHTLTGICSTITYHLNAAQSAAAKSELLTPDNLITTLCAPIRESVALTMREQQKAKDFLKAYNTA
ncbi:MAG TPA: hypothetical protein VLF43_01780 [Candidatus Saccharimonadales bacterium]|nr:hypothetical protein [Candidatus Saccharimonadales bacterium]